MFSVLHMLHTMSKWSLCKEAIQLFHALKGEVLRVLLLVGIGLLLLQPDHPTAVLVAYSFGMSFLLIAAAHLARKILFRHLDMEELTREVFSDNNVAAAIVFLAVCLVIIALMFIMAAPLLKG